MSVIVRETNETKIRVELGAGGATPRAARVDTGIPFRDHGHEALPFGEVQRCEVEHAVAGQ